MQLNFLKGSSHVEEDNDDDNGLLHGTNLLKELVNMWSQKNCFGVCDDSYFASVICANEIQ